MIVIAIVVLLFLHSLFFSHVTRVLTIGVRLITPHSNTDLNVIIDPSSDLLSFFCWLARIARQQQQSTLRVIIVLVSRVIIIVFLNKRLNSSFEGSDIVVYCRHYCCYYCCFCCCCFYYNWNWNWNNNNNQVKN